MELLVLGLDGATFKIIKSLIREDKLPTIAKMIKEGVYGICKSTHPPVTKNPKYRNYDYPYIYLRQNF